MAVHTIAFSTATPSTSGAADVPASYDQIIAIQNNHFVLTKPMQWLAGFACRDTLRGVFVNIASDPLRPTVFHPLSTTAAPPTDPNVMVNLRSPPTWPAQEEIAMAAGCGTGGSGALSIVCWLSDGIDPVPAGESYLVAGIASEQAAAPANAWTPLKSLQWVTPFASGEYAVIGFMHYKDPEDVATGDPIAARLVFDEQSWRPGTLSSPSVGARTHDLFMDGSLGVLGRFQSYSPPRVEVFCNATGPVKHVVILRVIKIS